MSLRLADSVLQQGDKKPHMPALDGLRATAILFVMCAHEVGDIPRRFFGLATAGWCGVDLFFVLSGFLITSGLLSTKGSTNYFRSFYGRRLIRIFPVYYLALVLYLVVLPRFFHDLPQPPSHDRIFYWLYINNWSAFMHVTSLHLIGHFWSLAVEEQFYLIWPAVVLFASRRHLMWIAAGCAAAAPVLRSVLVLGRFNHEAIYRNTFCRMDGLMLGAVCALVLSNPSLRERTLRRLPLVGVAGAVLLTLPWVLFGPAYYTSRMLAVGLSLCDLGFACLLVCCILAPKYFALLAWKPIRFVGVISYGVYVYHLGLMYLVYAFPFFGRGMVRLGWEIVLSLMVAGLSYTLYERPILSLKRFFVPKWPRRLSIPRREVPSRLAGVAR